MERVIPKKFISFFEMHDWDRCPSIIIMNPIVVRMQQWKNSGIWGDGTVHRKRGKIPWVLKSHNVIFPPNSHAFKHFTGDSYDLFLRSKVLWKTIFYTWGWNPLQNSLFSFYVLQRGLNKLPFTWAYGWTFCRKTGNLTWTKAG